MSAYGIYRQISKQIFPRYPGVARALARHLAMKEVKRRLQAQGMHVNSRHHGLAIAQGRRNRMRHLMMEFYSLDDV